jgi:hypothetical protein
MISGNTDIELLLTFNSLLGSNDLHNRRLWDFGNNSLFRGFLIFFSLLALWFSDDCIKRRSRMLAGLSATCLAGPLVVLVAASHYTPHTPAFGPGASFKYRRSTMGHTL